MFIVCHSPHTPSQYALSVLLCRVVMLFNQCNTYINIFLFSLYIIIYNILCCPCSWKKPCLSGIVHFGVFRCPQLKSIYCGMARHVVFRLPLFAANLWDNRLRLPSLYAMIILLLFICIITFPVST